MRTTVWGLLGVWLLLFSCTSVTDTAGNSTDEGNARIAGTVVDKQGGPVKNASVSLYNHVGRQSTSELAAQTTTNDKGRFLFEGVRGGTYDIMAVSQDSTLVHLVAKREINGGIEYHELDTQRLEPVSSVLVLTAISPGNIDSTVVSIPGTPWQSSSPGIGTVRLPLLTRGHYGIVVAFHYHVWGKPFRSVVHADTLTLKSSQNIVIDSVKPPLFGRDSTILIFDDFEDGNLIPPGLGIWTVYGFDNQLQLPDTSIRKASAGGSSGSGYALQVVWDGFVGEVIGGIRTTLRHRLVDPNIRVFQSFDLSNLDSISFDARGGPVQVIPELYLFHPEYGALLDTVVIDNDEWSRYVIGIEKSDDSADDAARQRLELVDRTGFILMPSPTDRNSYPGTLWIDNIVFHF